MGLRQPQVQTATLPFRHQWTVPGVVAVTTYGTEPPDVPFLIGNRDIRSPRCRNQRPTGLRPIGWSAGEVGVGVPVDAWLLVNESLPVREPQVGFLGSGDVSE